MHALTVADLKTQLMIRRHNMPESPGGLYRLALDRLESLERYCLLDRQSHKKIVERAYQELRVAELYLTPIEYAYVILEKASLFTRGLIAKTDFEEKVRRAQGVLLATAERVAFRVALQTATEKWDAMSPLEQKLAVNPQAWKHLDAGSNVETQGETEYSAEYLDSLVSLGVIDATEAERLVEMNSRDVLPDSHTFTPYLQHDWFLPTVYPPRKAADHTDALWYEYLLPISEGQLPDPIDEYGLSPQGFGRQHRDLLILRDLRVLRDLNLTTQIETLMNNLTADFMTEQLERAAGIVLWEQQVSVRTMFTQWLHGEITPRRVAFGVSVRWWGRWGILVSFLSIISILVELITTGPINRAAVGLYAVGNWCAVFVESIQDLLSILPGIVRSFWWASAFFLGSMASLSLGTNAPQLPGGTAVEITAALIIGVSAFVTIRFPHYVLCKSLQYVCIAVAYTCSSKAIDRIVLFVSCILLSAGLACTLLAA